MQSLMTKVTRADIRVAFIAAKRGQGSRCEAHGNSEDDLTQLQVTMQNTPWLFSVAEAELFSV